jgi:hypothetical protein
VAHQAEERVQDRGRGIGGGEWDIKALTVSTYDSAYIHADKQKPSRLPEAGYEVRQRSGSQKGTSCQERVKWSGLDPENAEILKI